MDTKNTITLKENLYILKAMVKKEFKVIMRYPLDFSLGFVQLFFWMLIFIFAALPFSSNGLASFGSGRFGNSILWGSIMFFIASDVIWVVGNGLRRAQRTGTLEQNVLAPIREWDIVLARAFRAIVSDVPFFLWTLLVIYLLTGYFVVKNPFLSTYAFTMAILSFLGFGFLYAAVIIWIKRANVLSNLLQFILMFFCAMFFPFSSLPPQILPISKLIPFSYNVDLFRSVIGGLPPELITTDITIFGVTLSPITFEILLVTLLSLALLSAGFLVFNFSIKKAKKEGTLAQY